MRVHVVLFVGASIACGGAGHGDVGADLDAASIDSSATDDAARDAGASDDGAPSPSEAGAHHDAGAHDAAPVDAAPTCKKRVTVVFSVGVGAGAALSHSN